MGVVRGGRVPPAVTPPFRLTLFSTDAAFVREAVAAGVDEVIVDWERSGKRSRQAGADTQIGCDTADDLRRVRASTAGRVLCRINGYGPTTASEVDTAVAAGADELLLPMVRSPQEVESVLGLAAGRCGVGMLVETVDAVRAAPQLGRLPVSRVYVGLNDLAIERGSTSIFAAVVDGTVERVRQSFDVPFGFAGLTLPDRGFPVPCRLLMGEMVRLGCSFSFLRRSFHADLLDVPLQQAVEAIREGLAAAAHRSPEQVVTDRAALHLAVAAAVEHRGATR